MKITLNSAISFTRNTAILGFLSASLLAAAACVPQAEAGAAVGGESCASDGDCASGQCVGATSCDSDGGGEEGEGPACEATDGVCAAVADDSPSPNPNNSGSCGSVGNGEYLCDSGTLYECANGSKLELLDCGGCKYIGAGTGHKYKTGCRVSAANWALDSNDPFPGPGCYFGSSLICD